ncbi:hypothetical protein YC2023_102068 [Brassica napus]
MEKTMSVFVSFPPSTEYDDISDSIAFGSHSNIKIWWKWLTIGYAYLGYIIEGQQARRVEQLGWRVIKEDYEKPFLAANLSFRPLPAS